MPRSKRSLILSFCIGGLVGGGLAVLLSQCLERTQRVKSTKKYNVRSLYGKAQEQSYENGIYCAPEGAEMHYDIGENIYYSSRE